jgi:hypothetical protein
MPSSGPKIPGERPKGLTMEGVPKAAMFLAVLVCSGSLYLGWQGTRLNVVEDGRFETNLGEHRSVNPSTTGEAVSQLSLLYVMDPSMYSFESVHIDDFTSDTVVAWMRGLRDALTATAANRGGSPLMVRCRSSL